MTENNKFTKEQLIARIEKQIDINATIIERLGDDSAATSELAVKTATMDMEILDIALAALTAGVEQEPVACIDLANLDYLESGAGADVWPASEADSDDVLLYAAPQLPQPAVVPHPVPAVKGELAFIDHLERIIGERDEDIDIGQLGRGNYDALMLAALDACRAAMLQGAEPVQRWIPCSERMPEEIGRYWCYVEEQNSLGKSHYQWNCSWNGDRWWVENENGGRVTHWMPLPAAPQQEP